MVSVSSMLLGVALSVASASATSASASAYDALPAFTIPSFDYPVIGQGANPERLLHELQTNGIVALRNVPNYAHTRQLYLQKAAECAMAGTHDPEADFVSQKQFADGTKRYTISTTAGSELAASAANTETTCPGFRQLYQEFSQLVEHAVNTFGSTLDATSFTASDGARPISSRKLVSEAIRLDHFHAYEAASAVEEAEHRELSYSLPLHEDHGLFIAMSAPKFFEVQETGERKLVERYLAADKSGLVIQTAAGERVRPVLNEDEVVIMMGSGASRWLQTSHQLPAVLHGMKMPELESATDNSRMLRTWFGKMTLLPAYTRMLESHDVTFDEHVNRTTRLLMATHQRESDVMAIGCAPGRRLHASGGACTQRACKLKPGMEEPDYGCAIVCNRQNIDPNDAKVCTDKCTCSDVGAGELCWNLCVLNLPEDKCVKSNQKCSGAEVICYTPTNDEAFTTLAPATSAPAPHNPDDHVHDDSDDVNNSDHSDSYDDDNYNSDDHSHDGSAAHVHIDDHSHSSSADHDHGHHAKNLKHHHHNDNDGEGEHEDRHKNLKHHTHDDNHDDEDDNHKSFTLRIRVRKSAKHHDDHDDDHDDQDDDESYDSSEE